jgi:aminoglycoside phosphotransferase family enzyme
VAHQLKQGKAEGPVLSVATLADKVGFLRCPDAYPHAVRTVEVRETHMSWVFLAGDRAYKLKKPVRYPYLDFSTLSRRAAACRAEAKLNRRLAPDVYLGVTPLTLGRHGLSIGGAGDVVDVLVVMRRLDERETLERALVENRLETRHLDRLIDRLARFYRRGRRTWTSPQRELQAWHRALLDNHRVLAAPQLDLPKGKVWRIERALRLSLAQCAGLIAGRVARHRILDVHGDLRPEHIWLDDEVRIIDCIEFNDRLRQLDPLDEIAYLAIECERLGSRDAAAYIERRLMRRLGETGAARLRAFYRCYRAALRARLAIAHLLESDPRTPEKWPRRARDYLALADREARALERWLKTRPSLRARRPDEACGSPRRTGALPAGRRPCL